jgi:hypothetical protein
LLVQRTHKLWCAVDRGVARSRLKNLDTLWVPENRMEVKVLPVPTADSWRVIEPTQK